MPLFNAEAVAIVAIEPRMSWVVDFDIIVEGGCNIFHYARGLKFDLAQIEHVLEGLVEGRLGMNLSPRHDMVNLNDCLRLVTDLMTYGQSAIDLTGLKAMSVLDGQAVPFKNFLYGVWMKYTNRCNLAKVGTFWDSGAAVKAREVVFRSPIEKEVISARGTIYSGRWVHRRTGKPMVIGDEYVFSHVNEWGIANGENPIRIAQLEERFGGLAHERNSPVSAVIDLVESEYPSDEEEKEPEVIDLLSDDEDEGYATQEEEEKKDETVIEDIEGEL